MLFHFFVSLVFVSFTPAWAAEEEIAISKYKAIVEGESPPVESPTKGIQEPNLGNQIDPIVVASADLIGCERPPVDNLKGFILTEYLDRCGRFAGTLSWTAADGIRAPYITWPQDYRNRLNEFFNYYQGWGKLSRSLQCHTPESTAVSFYYRSPEALDIYLAHMAFAFHVEISRLVPWSLTSWSVSELNELLNSQSFFAPMRVVPGSIPVTGFRAGVDFYTADYYQSRLCDPRIAYSFLSGAKMATRQSLIGTDAWSTLTNITLWGSRNFGHGGGGSALALNQILTAQPYAGYTPIITRNGCHSASMIVLELARGVNIPLRHIRAREPISRDRLTLESFVPQLHSGLIYRPGRPDARMLWHADDIGMINEISPSLPVDADGRLVSREIADQRLIEHLWLSPEVLSTWGFVFYSDLQKIISGEGVAAFETPKFVDPEGYFAGHWLPYDDARTTPAASRVREFGLHIRANLCSVSFVRALYCSSDQLLDNVVTGTVRNVLGLQSSFGWTTPVSSAPDAWTITQFGARALACGRAIGGCAALPRVNEVLGEHLRNLGREGWAD